MSILASNHYDNHNRFGEGTYSPVRLNRFAKPQVPALRDV